MHKSVAQLLEGFKALLSVYSPSCIVADAMEREGVLHSAIKPVSGKRFVGVAVTVKLYPGDLVDCLDALKVAGEGDAIVVDACGETETSVWGGLMSGLCKRKGVAGAVVDGAVRDIDEIRDLDFPLWARAIVPRSTHSPYSKRLWPLSINIPIQCGGVIVNPGDFIIADEIGVVVVPANKAADVLSKAQEMVEKEERIRARIREGKTVENILQEFGRF